MFHNNQQAYYDAINRANDEAESTVFVEFMLSVIKSEILDGIVSVTVIDGGLTDKTSIRWAAIRHYLRTLDFFMNANVRDLCGVPSSTANRILNELVKEEKLRKYRERRSWAYALQNKH